MHGMRAIIQKMDARQIVNNFIVCCTREMCKWSIKTKRDKINIIRDIVWRMPRISQVASTEVRTDVTSTKTLMWNQRVNHYCVATGFPTSPDLKRLASLVCSHGCEHVRGRLQIWVVMGGGCWKPQVSDKHGTSSWCRSYQARLIQLQCCFQSWISIAKIPFHLQLLPFCLIVCVQIYSGFIGVLSKMQASFISWIPSLLPCRRPRRI